MAIARSNTAAIGEAAGLNGLQGGDILGKTPRLNRGFWVRAAMVVLASGSVALGAGANIARADTQRPGAAISPSATTYGVVLSTGRIQLDGQPASYGGESLQHSTGIELDQPSNTPPPSSIAPEDLAVIAHLANGCDARICDSEQRYTIDSTGALVPLRPVNSETNPPLDPDQATGNPTSGSLPSVGP